MDNANIRRLRYERGWKSKEELEQFLSEHVDGEPVSVVEENPCFVTDVSLAKYGLIGNAVIYKNAEGKLYAVLVPFGVGQKTVA